MIEAQIKGIDLKFITAPGVFSPRAVDMGTLCMLLHAEFLPGDKILDLGCGYGPVGITAARLIGEGNVTLCDIDETSLNLAVQNACLNGVPGVKAVLSDGFDALDEKDFTMILSNPPYNSDFSLAKRFIEKGFNRLVVGGRLIMVTKRLDWYKNKLAAVFGNVRVIPDSGYFVFISKKRGETYSNRKKRPK